MKIQGCLTALLTPFTPEGEVDGEAFRDFCSWQVSQGVDGLVPCGTSGESPTLTHDEHRRLIDICVGVADGRVPVIAGTGSNATHEAIGLTRHAKQAGCQAALVVVPYYNRPGDEGLYAHYMAIADAVDLPLIIYNIPGRTGSDIGPELMGRLAQHPNIAGVKEATGQPQRVARHRISAGEDFLHFSGDDILSPAYLAYGAHGTISVTSNIAPAAVADFHRRFREGEIAGARQVFESLVPLHTALFLESNPAPLKYAASLLGRCGDTLRLPLVLPSERTREAVRQAMHQAGLLS